MPREQGGSDDAPDRRDPGRLDDWQRIEAEQDERDAIGRKWDATHDPSPEFEQQAMPLGPDHGRDRPRHRDYTPEQQAELEATFGRPIEELLALRDKDPRAGQNRDEQGRILNPDGTPTEFVDPRQQLLDRQAERETEVGGRGNADAPGGELPRRLGDGDRVDRDTGSNTEDARAEQQTNEAVDRTLDELNPGFDRAKSAYSENCTGVVQAYELRRRGVDVQPGPLEKHLRTDEGGPGGRFPEVIERVWGRQFTPGTKAEIESAFGDNGSRGVVLIHWPRNLGGGGHVFNVENVDGTVRFVDGQPSPARTDASRYFAVGHRSAYLRLDDLAHPARPELAPYLESTSENTNSSRGP